MRRRNSKKIDPRGAVVELTKRVIVRSERGLSGSGAPCGGDLQLYEEPSPDKSGMCRAPSIPWDDSWEPGTLVNVEIVVRVVKAAPKSRKRCHNPWPAHVCDDGKWRNARKRRS